MNKKTLEVCAAVVFWKGRLLNATRRPGGSLEGYWEFPGGKCAVGETLAVCIARELAEELGIEVTGAGELLMLSYEYPDKIVNLHFMQCAVPNPEAAKGLEGQAVGWHAPSDLAKMEFAPADRLFLDIVSAGDFQRGDLRMADEAGVRKLAAWLRDRA